MPPRPISSRISYSGRHAATCCSGGGSKAGTGASAPAASSSSRAGSGRAAGSGSGIGGPGIGWLLMPLAKQERREVTALGRFPSLPAAGVAQHRDLVVEIVAVEQRPGDLLP